MFFRRIWEALEAGGFTPYSIGQHNGVCKSPYVVIKDDGQSPYAGLPINNGLIDIIIFYPFGGYSEVEPYRDRVDRCLRSIRELKPTHIITPIIIDDDKKAYTTSIKYQIRKRRN